MNQASLKIDGSIKAIPSKDTHLLTRRMDFCRFYRTISCVTNKNYYYTIASLFFGFFISLLIANLFLDSSSEGNFFVENISWPLCFIFLIITVITFFCGKKITQN